MAEQRRLYDGTRNTGLTVRPDPDWPDMWRIHYPDGTVSDMVNISRATDAAMAWLSRTSLSKDRNTAVWKAGNSPTRPATADKSLPGQEDLPHG